MYDKRKVEYLVMLPNGEYLEVNKGFKQHIFITDSIDGARIQARLHTTDKWTSRVVEREIITRHKFLLD